jgi:penicillin-binding protein 2
MSAQLANGGYKIEPKIIYNEQALQPNTDVSSERFKQLYRNQENIKFVLDAQFGATNEPMGTSYGSRHVKSEYIFAGKTGTSQIRAITAEERELKLKQKDLPYKRRDHALFTAFAPYKNPQYALSIVIEHGGTGSSSAAPIAKKLIKKILDRHQLRKKYQLDLFQEI